MVRNDPVRLILPRPASARAAADAAAGYGWPEGKVVTEREKRHIPIVSVPKKDIRGIKK